MNEVLLITPPFTQLNTPYPATCYLKGFLNTKGISATQMDLGIELTLNLFSKEGLERLFAAADTTDLAENESRIYSLRQQYVQSIDAVILFLQGNQPTLARQICTRKWLPEASRFTHVEDLSWSFGNMGLQDQAKHLATLYLEDLSDFIVATVDPDFGFSRYAERLGLSANSFDEIYDELQAEHTFIDELLIELLEERILHAPKMVCFSVPFPGNLRCAFRCAEWFKNRFPNARLVLGGGFPNTELRSVADARVFEYFDCITLDDGELPIERLYHTLDKALLECELKRTFHLQDNKVIYNNRCTQHDYKQHELGTPDYSDLLLDKYISVIEVTNPMHSLWSDGRWNKLTMAHGCYWGKCTFCDISLDYIRVYEPIAARELVDRMENLMEQTGETGFHFVDEAAPPALMRELALEIIKRGLTVTWWTNIRFEKSFTADLCRLLSASGCVAVSGGLEVASDRLLKLIDKGVTVEQVAQVTRSLTDAGIMVHAYLMYGYPTQTVQETVDSLEMVRQLFEEGVVQSGFWHQFALTAHSPVGQDPDAYGIFPKLEAIGFANNDVQFTDSTGIDHDKFSKGLKTSLFNYMNGTGFDLPLQQWFDFKLPRPTIHPELIYQYLSKPESLAIKDNAKVIWLGNSPQVSEFEKRKKGKTWQMMELTFHISREMIAAQLEVVVGEWLLEKLQLSTVAQSGKTTLKAWKESYEKQWGDDFELFWFSKPMKSIKKAGLLVV